MSAFQTINVRGTGAATPVVSAGDDPALIINTGSNTVYLGEDSSADSSNSNKVAPLLSGASVTSDGSIDLYAICLPGQTTVISVYPGGHSFFGA